MVRSKTLCQIITNSARIIFIALFVYAATSKLLDFDQFKIQLGQSPILTAYADWIAWGVPSIELVIAGLLLFPRWILIAFFSSLSLMTSFTTYIFLILNASEYIPCSCGGVLENMGWSEHLVLNLILIGLAIVSILLTSKTNDTLEKIDKDFIT